MALNVCMVFRLRIHMDRFKADVILNSCEVSCILVRFFFLIQQVGYLTTHFEKSRSFISLFFYWNIIKFDYSVLWEKKVIHLFFECIFNKI